jgi:hypothetical protein
MNPDDLTPERDWDAEREIAEFLAGVPKDPASIMRAFDERSTAEEAELVANGIRPVTVVHGDVESYEDEALIYGTDDPARPGLHGLAEQVGEYHRTVGGHGFTTWFFDGPDAEQAAVRFMAAVIAIAPDGWVVTPTAQPKRY